MHNKNAHSQCVFHPAKIRLSQPKMVCFDGFYRVLGIWQLVKLAKPANSSLARLEHQLNHLKLDKPANHLRLDLF